MAHPPLFTQRYRKSVFDTGGVMDTPCHKYSATSGRMQCNGKMVFDFGDDETEMNQSIMETVLEGAPTTVAHRQILCNDAECI